jgi:hypothetical protein
VRVGQRATLLAFCHKRIQELSLAGLAMMARKKKSL